MVSITYIPVQSTGPICTAALSIPLGNWRISYIKNLWSEILGFFQALAPAQDVIGNLNTRRGRKMGDKHESN
jgi:hypothetical protein